MTIISKKNRFLLIEINGFVLAIFVSNFVRFQYFSIYVWIDAAAAAVAAAQIIFMGLLSLLISVTRWRHVQRFMLSFSE